MFVTVITLFEDEWLSRRHDEKKQLCIKASRFGSCLVLPCNAPPDISTTSGD
jgi:hypothetical protein